MQKVCVKVVLRGHLMWYPEKKQKHQIVSARKNARVIDLIKRLNVPIEQVGFILKNGQKVDASLIVNDGDEIELVPIIAGG